MSDAKPTVLYITGMMRCGSTIIGNILNEQAKMVHIGERYFLWKNALLRDGTNSVCGCGSDLLKCDLWSRILGRSDMPEQGAARKLWQAQQRHIRVRHTMPHLLKMVNVRGKPGNIEDVLDASISTYRAVASETGAEVIVDSSKVPTEIPLLSQRDDIDLRVLHVVRDPRATVASYSSAKDYLDRWGISRTLTYWAGFNLASEAVAFAMHRTRYMRVKYEDFARHPGATIESISSFAGLPCGSTNAIFASDSSVVLNGNHTVTGNPDRLQKGEITIRSNERWRQTMPLSQKAIAWAGSAPLMLRYGYLR